MKRVPVGTAKVLRGVSVTQREFRERRRIEKRFCISPAEDGCGSEPKTSKNPKLLGVFWGSYYTVIRRDSLSTV